MAISLADSFAYKGKSPDFTRQLFDTISDMKAFSENYLPDLYLAFNKEDSNLYSFNRSNPEDPLTGKWRKFEPDGGGASDNNYTDADKAKVDKIGDWSTLKISDVDSIVGCLNSLLDSSVAKIVYADGVLTTKDANDNAIEEVDISSILNDSFADSEFDDTTNEIVFKNKDGTELKRVDLSDLKQEFALQDLTDIEIVDLVDKQQIRYDLSTQKWVNFTDTTLNTAKQYTDDEISKLVINHGIIVETKPEATDPDIVEGDWYYWQDSDDVWWQTRFLKNPEGNLVELTIRVGSIDLSDYVSFTLNVDSTYVETPADTAKIPDISWVLGLRTYLIGEIAKKVNIDDIVDNLTSTDTNKPLSANQGKVLDEKKVNIDDIVDDLESTNTDKPLSANQGKELKDLIDSLSESGGLAFTEESGTMSAVGGLAKGSIVKGQTDHQVLQKILFPYTKPTITLTGNQNALQKVGTTISSVTLTAVATKNSNPITNVIFNANGSAIETITEGVASGGTFTTTYSNAVTNNISFSAVVSDGTNSNTATYGIEFIYPMYYGISGGTLTEVLQKKGKFTYNHITCTNAKPVFRYPASYGYLQHIYDKNAFENIDSFTSSLVDVDGVSYVQYELTTPATLSDFSFEFIF